MKFRHEFKHQINQADLLQLKTRLSAIMDHDKHSGPDGTYEIKSLYFDNYRDKALKEKQDGVNIREKFRIRYYNNDTTVIRLEKKSKVNGLCLKKSTILTKEMTEAILNGDYSWMLRSNEPLLLEFYSKIKSQGLNPDF